MPAPRLHQSAPSLILEGPPIPGSDFPPPSSPSPQFRHLAHLPPPGQDRWTGSSGERDSGTPGLIGNRAALHPQLREARNTKPRPYLCACALATRKDGLCQPEWKYYFSH
nr:neural Wiskott-Aldrich syndrome protein-like [Cavia porcellus]